MGKKQDVITELYKICEKRKDFVFGNELVKTVCKKYKFGNPFDVTALSHTSKLPDILKSNDCFISHKGKGNHAFIKGISIAYHKFETIPISRTWQYRKSLLEEFDTSESNVISYAINQGILFDFLYDDVNRKPFVYYSQRFKSDLDFRIGRAKITANQVRFKSALILEDNGVVTIIGGKKGLPQDFAVNQFYYPFSYFCKLKNESNLDVKQINCCYVLRGQKEGNSTITVFLYTFENEDNMASIQLLKSTQYHISKR